MNLIKCLPPEIMVRRSVTIPQHKRTFPFVVAEQEEPNKLIVASCCPLYNCYQLFFMDKPCSPFTARPFMDQSPGRRKKNRMSERSKRAYSLRFYRLITKHLFVCESETVIAIGFYDKLHKLFSVKFVSGQIAVTVSKWRPFSIFKKRYVLNALLILKTSRTKRKRVKIATFWYLLVIFIHQK